MFEGFSPETIDFLWGIRMNNNREWFTENKKNYVNHLYEPMKALGKELFEPFMDAPGNILKVSRIYRDARMHYPQPYKETLWICIRKDVEWWAEAPCLYFEITPDGASYGFFYYKPGTAALERMRQEWAAHPQQFLTLMQAMEDVTGIPVTAETYKRPKEAPIPELAPYYAWKGCISCCVDVPVGPELFDPNLMETVREFFVKLIPLYEYFSKY